MNYIEHSFVELFCIIIIYGKNETDEIQIL